ncbi:ribose-5-phosphate isomerase [Biomphalaria glabrata]|uniref:ribose-5-phosphate isomerase n=1 Tax=Biomphalaria glabrata TaxID=6526 RepID=A0A9U8E945_BIOGL|nr:ribose-5-phosphate isomerase-like [Biomphalaria glabrata]KAI8758361.1 ribose-5-phosphate isomerase-like [Biomphalaria glabrata]KAI8791878.1 ribose-5-phosphate isomerase [Biomphalaria glabrata]
MQLNLVTKTTFYRKLLRTFLSQGFSLSKSNLTLGHFHTSLPVMADTSEAGKIAAANKAVDENIKEGQVVGIGSGTTIVFAVKRIAERNKVENLNLICIPTSFQARQLINDHGLTLGSLETSPDIDVAIDGADEVDSDINLIKGGGGCLMQEKIIASCAKELFIIADTRKNSEVLGTSWKKGIPIEVLPMAYRPVQLKIAQLLGGKPLLRMASQKAGPVVTDNGNFLIDWQFEGKHDWYDVDRILHNVPGVIETGLFLNMTKTVYFGTPDGQVIIKSKKN